jgi:hypothetical protein
MDNAKCADQVMQIASVGALAKAVQLPLQVAPVMRVIVQSAISSDAGLGASDFNNNEMPINYFVHVQ